MPLTPKEFIRLIKKNGFVRQKSNNGSHQKFYNAERNITLIVPVHAKEFKKGIEMALLKQAGLTKE